MKHLALLIIVVFFSQQITSQTYEIGLFAGGANYIGDVGSTTYLSPNKPAIGAVAKWNRSFRHALRVSYIHAKLSADDAKGDDRRQERGFSFDNSINEVSVGIEYNFWEWNPFDGQTQTMPYLYTGVNAFNFSAAPNDIYSSRWSFAVPLIVGLKKSIGRNFVLGMELGARYTFTDNIDGSNPDSRFGTGFGNLNNNDWYMFTGITVGVSWGREPCFCDF